MGKPHEHAASSVETFGGKPEDYLKIHELLDSSKVTFGDVRHRILTHNRWFIENILLLVFGNTITNSDDVEVSVERIAEQHIVEDYPQGRFVPAVSDWLCELPMMDWMRNDETGAVPPSRHNVPQYHKESEPEEESSSGSEEQDTSAASTAESLLDGLKLKPFDQGSFEERPCSTGGPGVMD